MRKKLALLIAAAAVIGASAIAPPSASAGPVKVTKDHCGRPNVVVLGQELLSYPQQTCNT